MQKIVLILIMICILPLTAFASDFIFDTGVRWDMSQKDLLKIEKNRGSKVKNKNADQAVVQAQYREHKNVLITYAFTDKALSGVEYTIRYGSQTATVDISYNDYLNLVDELTASYGKPVKSGLNWNVAETLRSSFEEQGKYGLAVGSGYLDAETVWEVTDRDMQIRVFLYSPEKLMTAVTVTYSKL